LGPAIELQLGIEKAVVVSMKPGVVVLEGEYFFASHGLGEEGTDP
jgi:hypothetical protein